MDIGFFVGHKHYLSHGILLIDTIKEHMKTSSITMVVKAEDYLFFLRHMGKKNIKIMKINSFSDYPYIDKIQGAAAFEKTCHSDYLWIDVDSYFNQEIKFSKKKGVHLNTVDIKNVGISYNEKISNPWELVSKELKLNYKDFPYRLTLISKERIYPYFNVGCVYVTKNKKLFHKTVKNIKSLLKNKAFMRIVDTDITYRIFFHQVIFTITLLKEYDLNEIITLPKGVNIPIHLYKKKGVDFNLNDISLFRYDCYFNKKPFDDQMPEALKNKANELTMYWYY